MNATPWIRGHGRTEPGEGDAVRDQLALTVTELREQLAAAQHRAWVFEAELLHLNIDTDALLADVNEWAS